MTTRRNFLKGGTAAATGIVFCSCGLLQSAHAQPAGSRTLPVSIGGKRVKTIDVHAHCHFREAGALLPADQAAAAQLPPVNGAAEAFIEIDKRLAAMDAQAVDMEVLSINPFWYGRERDLAAQIVKVQNEKLAELCASKPDRFAAFASLTLQAPDLAVTELETAVKKQGLKGAAIGGAAGVLGGLIGSFVIGRSLGWSMQVSLDSILLATLFSIAVGAFFGYYPARRASRLDPIESLRYE